MSILRTVSLLLTATAVVGCAGVDVVKVAQNDAKTHGIRYSRPLVLLALKETIGEKGTTCEVQTFEIEDKSQQYAINVRGGWGSVEANPQLEDGWKLTSLSTKADSKGPETITAIGNLLTAAAGAAKTFQGRDMHGSGVAKSRTVSNCRGIYAPQYDGGGNFDGFRRFELPLHV